MNRKQAEQLIAEERRRQIEKEGWTPEHDDEHTNGEMLRAAIFYMQNAIIPFGLAPNDNTRIPDGWPWDEKWWKPKTPTHDLIKAGALCEAECDRLYRCQGTVNLGNTMAWKETIIRLLVAV